MLVLATVVLCCNKVSKSDTDQPERSGVVKVIKSAVIRDSIPLPIHIPGKLASSSEMKLGFKTGGIIREMNAVEGADVRQGKKIARLDTVELVAWRNKAKTALEKAQRDRARAEKLYTDSVVTLEQLQNARSACDAAKADFAVASFNLSQAVLSAPTAGKIIRRLAEKNEVVGPGMPVVLFASTDGKWLIKAAVPDCDLAEITIGDTASATFDAIPDREFIAVLVRIAGAAHPVTGTFEIECALKDNHQRFRPGLVADVRLFPRNQKKFSYVPAGALVEGNGTNGTILTYANHDSLVALSVTVEKLYGDLLAVAEGLEGIDSVVSAGAPYLWYSNTKLSTEKR